MSGSAGKMVGKAVGHYKILQELAAPASGPLFVAEDLGVHERVIVKVLPCGPLSAPSLKQLLIREAGAASRLEHPHVIANLGIEDVDGRTVLVFEPTEAEPLARRIGRGPGTEGQVLSVALDVLDALDAAHEYGLLHADLCPENILIDSEGRGYLIGLGLGKTAEPLRRGSGRGRSPYVAPEQAANGRSDERSDLFSLGVILYQWLTGALPFPTVGEEFYRKSVPGEKPVPPSGRVPGISKKTEALLLTALEPEEGRRFQSAWEMRARVEEALGRSVPTEREPPPVEREALVPAPGDRRSWLTIAGGGFVLAVAALGAWYLSRGPSEQVPREPIVTLTRITAWGGVEADPCISPDGKRVAFASDASGNWDLWVADLDGESITQITDSPADERYPSWSPDGSEIVYSPAVDSGRILVIPASGGASRELSPFGFRPSWSPTGRQIAFDAWTPVSRSRIWLVDAEGGQPIQLTESPDPEEVHVRPQWSPDGREVIFDHRNEKEWNVWAVGVETKVQNPLTQSHLRDFGGLWDPSGIWLYFCSGVGDSVHIFRTKPEVGRRFQTTRRPGYYSSLSMSRDGRRMVFSNVELHSALWGVRVADGQVERLETGLARTISPSFSPDGQRIAMASDEKGTWDIYILEGGMARRITSDASDEHEPRWSPDGEMLAFVARLREGLSVKVVRADGTGERTIFSDGVNLDPRWSPDGRMFAFVREGTETRSDIWVAEVSSGEARCISRDGLNSAPRWSPDGSQILFHSRGETWSGLYTTTAGGWVFLGRIAEGRGGCWSPGGEWIAYSAGPVSREDIWLTHVGTASANPVTGLAAGFCLPTWSPDGNWLAFLSDWHGSPDVWVLPLEGGPPRLLAEDTNLRAPPAWSPDSRWLLFTKEEDVAGDIWMYELSR